jgi:hypothetical protein
MKKYTVSLLSLLLASAAFAAPKASVRDVVREKESKRVEISALKGATKEAARVQRLSQHLEQVAEGRAGRTEIAAAIAKSPSARQAAERLARADETVRSLDPKDFAPGEVDSALTAIKTNAEFLSLGNRLSVEAPGMSSPQKAALLKMFEIDIMNMSKEERDSYVQIMRAAVDARTSPTMDGDAALAKVVNLEKLKELINCKI